MLPFIKASYHFDYATVAMLVTVYYKGQFDDELTTMVGVFNE